MISPPHSQPDNAELADLQRAVIELRDWQNAVLGCCKACDGFDAMEWGGDKDGWGFVMYFISHLNTRALHAETVLAEQDHARCGVQNSDDIHTLIEQLRAENDILRDKLARAQSPVGWGTELCP